MSALAPRVRDLIRQAVKVQVEINKLRFRMARAAASRLAAIRSRPSFVEINSHLSLMWLPENSAFELRLYPQSLTGLPEGWLAARPYARRTAVIPVDWPSVYAALAPTFSYNPGVISAVRDAVKVFTDIALEPHTLAVEAFDGAVNYGDHNCFYVVEPTGIRIICITRYESTDSRLIPVTVETMLTSTSCALKNQLRQALTSLSDGITVRCPNDIEVKVSHYANECAALDHLITYVRQILDKQMHCPVVPAARVAFTSGPLMGLVWPENMDNMVIVYDGESAKVVNVRDLIESIDKAVELCRESIRNLACQAAGKCPEGTVCMWPGECAHFGGKCLQSCPEDPNNCCCQLGGEGGGP